MILKGRINKIPEVIYHRCAASYTPPYLTCPRTEKLEVFGSGKKVICVLQCSSI